VTITVFAINWILTKTKRLRARGVEIEIEEESEVRCKTLWLIRILRQYISMCSQTDEALEVIVRTECGELIDNVERDRDDD